MSASQGQTVSVSQPNRQAWLTGLNGWDLAQAPVMADLRAGGGLDGGEHWRAECWEIHTLLTVERVVGRHCFLARYTCKLKRKKDRCCLSPCVGLSGWEWKVQGHTLGQWLLWASQLNFQIQKLPPNWAGKGGACWAVSFPWRSSTGTRTHHQIGRRKAGIVGGFSSLILVMPQCGNEGIPAKSDSIARVGCPAIKGLFDDGEVQGRQDKKLKLLPVTAVRCCRHLLASCWCIQPNLTINLASNRWAESRSMVWPCIHNKSHFVLGIV